MNDEKEKRRSVAAIAHLFLSCQDENNGTTACNHHAAPLGAPRLPSGMRIVTSDPRGRETWPAVSQPLEGQPRSIEPRVLATGPTGHPAGQSEGLESKGSIQLMIDPRGYPVARLVWAQAAFQDELSQATIPLRKEVWLDVAGYCQQHAERLEVLGQGELAETCRRVADLIMDEITADEKRQRNRDIYASFADFISTISVRTDIDKARKAQIIHDKACQLKLD